MLGVWIEPVTAQVMMTFFDAGMAFPSCFDGPVGQDADGSSIGSSHWSVPEAMPFCYRPPISVI